MQKSQWKDYILELFGVVNVSTFFLHLKGKNSLDHIKKGNSSPHSEQKEKGKASCIDVMMVDLGK